MRRAIVAGSTLLLLSALRASPGFAGEPAALVSVDPLSRPAPTMLEALRFVPDGKEAGDRIQAALWQAAMQQEPDSQLSIIVTLHEPVLPANLRGNSAEADAFREQWVASMAHEFAAAASPNGMTGLRALSHFPILFGKARSGDLSRLAALPNVRSIELDGILRELRTQGASLMSADDLRVIHGGNGSGVGVAVIDSGVEDVHAELSPGVVVAQGDFSGEGADGTVDGTGHGTAVAGIIAGQSGGMARQATIWALKVLDNSGSGNFSNVESALNAAYSNRNSFGGLDIINMSIGAPPTVYNADCDAVAPSMATIVNTLVAAGIPFTVSSGNDGALNGVFFPSCLSNVLSVGAVTDAAFNPDPYCGGAWPADAITCYSNSGVPLDILAPSHCAATTGLGGGSVSCFSGTSAAAPYAAGVAAQILSLLPATTPAQLRNAFMTTGRPRPNINGITRNRIDALEAYLALGAGGGPCVPDAETLCIDDLPGDHRFKVKVFYNSVLGGGVSGYGKAMPLGSLGVDHGGLFWFFNADNPEMLIKVLSGCGDNGHFWLFSSAGTNLGMTTTVTDTVGVNPPFVFVNPDLTPAVPVATIYAFVCN